MERRYKSPALWRYIALLDAEFAFPDFVAAPNILTGRNMRVNVVGATDDRHALVFVEHAMPNEIKIEIIPPVLLPVVRKAFRVGGVTCRKKGGAVS